MLRNMVIAFFEHGKIVTTIPKAKEVRRLVEKIVTLTKRARDGAATEKGAALRVHAVRQARLWISDREILQKIFAEVPVRFMTRNGGYTRIVKLGFRPGDNAPMCLLEMVEDSI
jgi:large subunit ribosomal protein L17